MIIALMTMIGPFTIDSYLPSFPAIEAEFNISRALLSQSLGFYLAAFALATLIFGPLTDRLGRRPVILISLLFYIAASIGCALANDYSTFLIYRILQGTAAAGGLVAGRAIIRDVYSPQDAHHALSRIMMLFAVAPAIAPVIGGWLHDLFGWHSVFYFLAIYSILIFFLVFFHIPETLSHTDRQSLHPVKVARVYGHTLMHHRFQALIFMVAFYFSGLFLYIAGAPTVIFDFLKLESSDFAFMFFPLVAGLIFGSWLSSRLAHRWAITRTIKLALTLMLIGSFFNVLQALWLTPMLITSFIPLSLYTTGIGIAMPAMTVLALDCFPRNRGTASALQGFVQMMANALIASLAVPLLDQLPGHLALGQFLLLVCALLLWWRLPKISN
ncbi:MAG: multidrug effflux MFS transporter [Gammaproteobacteria bacterium]|nr:multidrug effflux MFS transporter [Gammaproteobacteria bacterium]